jgi:transposase, IS5 family
MKLHKEQAMTIFNYDLDQLVDKKHPLREISELVNFKKIAYLVKGIEEERLKGRKGYGWEIGLKCLFLQYYFDLSDREAERQIRDSLAMRWFLGLSLEEVSPDHSFFHRTRTIIGTKRIGKVLAKINQRAKEAGTMKDIFSFVDASSLKAKETTWTERDKALKEGEEKLNNDNVSKYSADKDARFGCKGKDKFWFGYKRHVSVDMGSGLIDKVAITPANVSDDKGLKYVCPKDKIIFGDKAYCLDAAQKTIKANSCESAAILKNNMKEKNKDRDKWVSKVRAPFENVFSKFSKKTKYRGQAKVQMQGFLEAIVFNVKRLVVLKSSPLFQEA